jgi:hypothetical protein
MQPQLQQSSSAQSVNLDQPLTVLPDQPERWINYGDAGVPFDAACEDWHRARAEDGEVHDLAVGDLSTWALGPVGQTAALAPIPVPGRPGALVPLRRRAWAQLCSLAGAPVQYINKLPARYQIALLNRHLSRDLKERGALVRGVGGEARALLSERYAPLDGERVLDTVRGVLAASGQLGSVRVRSLAVGETASLRVTFPEHDAIVRGTRQINDVVEVGLDILNGEVGNRALSLSPLVWRLVCLNGMRRPSSTEDAARFRHVGDPERLHQAFADALPVAIAGGQRLRDLMAASTDVMIDDALAEFDLSAFGLSPVESQDVARDVLAERAVALPASTSDWGDVLADVRDLTAYDVANGITHVAQSRGTDRRVELEEAASRYLDRAVRRSA